jgi:hypothetical protein
MKKSILRLAYNDLPYYIKYVFGIVGIVLISYFVVYFGTLMFYGATISGDCNNGYGIMSFDDGGVIMGQFNDGEINGPGIAINPNGSSFLGVFSKGTRLKGILTIPNNSEYIGEFENDVFHGQGVWISANGDKYIGEFINGTYVEK